MMATGFKNDGYWVLSHTISSLLWSIVDIFSANIAELSDRKCACDCWSGIKL